MDQSVLVVDDDRALRASVARILRDEGFSIVEAEDATSALALARSRSPVAAVLDVVMPAPDGVALLGWLKAADPDLSVVMLTGQHDLHIAIACLNKGADAFLLKPFQADELLAVLRRSLERRRLVLENRSYQKGLEQMVGERTRELGEATERLRELDQLKNEFVSRVSHELRSPLTVMATNLSVLLERLVGPLAPQQVQLLESCQQNIDRLSRMVENVLDLSRIESGRLDLVPEQVDARQLVTSVVTYFQPVAREREVELHADPEGASGGSIWADADKMYQVLMNLVDNALKFTPRGGRVSVSIESLTDAVRFAVQDTGMGVQAEDRDRLFDRFFQGQVANGTKRRGAGLGLSIARHFVELHGGAIEVSSEEGRGATFAFSIPRSTPPSS